MAYYVCQRFVDGDRVIVRRYRRKKNGPYRFVYERDGCASVFSNSGHLDKKVLREAFRKGAEWVDTGGKA